VKKLKKEIDCQKNRKIPIVQKDFDGNVIKIWSCVKDASKSISGNNSTSSIRNCINGKYLHAYGFKWEYLDEKRNKEVVSTHRITPRIVQMNLNGEVVKIWDWLEQAKKAGFPHVSISKCCKKEKMYYTCCGYKWEYYDNNKNTFLQKIIFLKN